MSVFYVYVLFDLEGAPRYVGKGKGRRWLRHEGRARHQNRRLRAIIADARSKGLELPKVKIGEGLSEEEAFFLERKLIQVLGRQHLCAGPLVNLTDGGDGESGRVISEDQREKLRIANAGKTLSEEHKLKISAALRGKKYSPEVVEKIRAGNKGKRRNWKPGSYERFVELQRLNNPGHAGHRHTEETKQKLREARARQATLRHTEAAKEKIRAAWIDRKKKARANQRALLFATLTKEVS